jgi:hypothetical protein
MVPEEWRGALGSYQLGLTYLLGALIRGRVFRLRYNAYGRDDFSSEQLLNPGPLPPLAAMPVDETAFKEYCGFLEKARLAGTRIVGVIPPVSPRHMSVRGSAFQAYFARFRPLFKADEPVIDLNAPEFETLWSNPANFPDHVHLSSGASTRVSEALNRKLAALGLVR